MQNVAHATKQEQNLHKSSRFFIGHFISSNLIFLNTIQFVIYCTCYEL